MDHKQFLATLPPKTNTQLHETANAPGLRALALHVAIILGLGTAIALRVPGWPVLMLPHGIALVFLFTLQHECTHSTPFRTPWLNEVIGHVCALLIAQPFLWFRYFHMAHHRFTNDLDRDPELQGAPKPRTRHELAWHLSSVAYWRDKIVLLAQNAFGTVASPYIPPRALPRLCREARLLIAAYVGLALVMGPRLLTIWLIPLALGFPVLRLYLLAEHSNCAHTPNMFANTRTVFTTALVRLLAWNMPWHVEHHTMPNVPFHRLAQLHGLIEKHLEQTEEGYARFAAHYVADVSDT